LIRKTPWTELRRRGVFKALGVYAASAFVLAQAADLIFPALGFPERAMTIVVILLIAGAPVAVVFAWLFDLTAQGVVRSGGADAAPGDVTPLGVQVIGRRTTLIMGVAAGALASGVVGLAGYVTLRGDDAESAETPAAGVTRVAVLPLRVLGVETGQEFLAEGITEDLIGALARISGVSVLARSTVYARHDLSMDPRDVGRALGVDAILDGTVRTFNDDLRVAAQLIDVESGVVLWSVDFQGSKQDVFAVQDSITGAVVARFAQSSPGTAIRVAAGTTENVEAYELYLKGRYSWNRRNPSGFASAIDFFNRAIAIDPGYARAYVGLADALMALSQFGVSPGSAVLPQAEAASRRALELGVNEAEIFNTAAHVAELFFRDWARAEQLYGRALSLDPTFATAHAWYGDLLMSRGRTEDALRHMTEAARLEPLSAPILFQLATTHLRMGHLDEAEQVYLDILELDPSYLSAMVYVGYVYAEMGDATKALAHLDEAVKARGGHPSIAAQRALVLARLGRTDEARAALTVVNQRPASTFVPQSYLAAIYANLGEPDRAMEHLTRFVNEDIGNVMFLVRDPWWEPLRSEPAYLSLMAELDLPTR
jgi:TolB-like protein/Flp pilus assembly protein TadD